MKRLKRRLKVIYTIVKSGDGGCTLRTKRGTYWDYRNPLPDIKFPSYMAVASYLMEKAPSGEHEVRWDGLSQLEQIAVQTLKFKLSKRPIDRHPVNGRNGSYRPNGSPVNRTLTDYFHK